MVSPKLKKLSKLLRELGIRVGFTAGPELTKQNPSVVRAKEQFPNSAILKELENIPEILAFHADLQSENSVFFISILDQQMDKDTQINNLLEFSKQSNVEKVLVIDLQRPIDDLTPTEFASDVRGFWIRERIQKPLRELVNFLPIRQSRKPKRFS